MKNIYEIVILSHHKFVKKKKFVFMLDDVIRALFCAALSDRKVVRCNKKPCGKLLIHLAK